MFYLWNMQKSNWRESIYWTRWKNILPTWSCKII